MDISLQTAEGLLTLTQLKDVGPQTALRLASRFRTVDELRGADNFQGVATIKAVSSIRDEEAWQTARRRAEAIYEKLHQHDIKIFSAFEPQYPTLLRSIPDPPALIYLKGTLRARSAACVGTRHPSYFGAEVARRISRMLSENGYSIVSGLALGIDTESHIAALDAGGHTVAILANGLDTVYPAKNKELATRILDQGGALVSEQPPGTRAFAQNLVQRDRLQSGMSLGTFVMQTDIVGGTMHTVRFTLEQQRLLFVPVPTPAYAEDPPSQGIRALAERTGKELVNIIKTTDPYRSLLSTRFAEQPPARAIKNSCDYQFVVQELQEAECKHKEAPTTQSTLF